MACREFLQKLWRDPDSPKMSVVNKIRIFAAEFVGSAILLFGGCLSLVTIHGPHTLEMIAWQFGLAIMISVHIFLPISGCHINPAVTLAVFIMGHIKEFILVPIYLLGEILGSLCGAGFARLVVPNFNWKGNSCCNVAGEHVAVWQSLITEMLMTFILIMMVCSAVDPRNKHSMDSLAIRFGLAITGLVFIGGEYSSAGLNPSRSLAPAIINNYWENHWVFWVGPLTGSAAAATLYRLVFLNFKKAEEEDETKN